MTNDVSSATTFDAQLFGWGTDEMDMGEMGMYTALMLGGGSVMAGPFDMDIGRSAACIDAQGASFQIMQLAEPAE